MKRILFVLLFLMMISAACYDIPVETAHIPMAAGISRPTPISDGNPEPTQSPSQNVGKEDSATAYPGPTDLGDRVITEVPLVIIEPTASPGSYPGLVETGTATPLVSEEPVSSKGTDLGSVDLNAMIPTYSFTIVGEYPHDRESFVQGLIVDDKPGVLLEGSGLWGESSLRRVDMETGSVTQFLPLQDQYFGEGITVFNDQVIQLTWKSGVGFIYDSDSFNLLNTFNYAHEGWGITHDGQQLIVSDGSATIHFWDPETLQETHQIQVNDEYGLVTQLNELEFVEGEIFANVWQTDTIVRIDPNSGNVIGRIDLTGLLSQESRDGSEDVLNGIAYDSTGERLFVTGKRWPTLYEIELVPVVLE